MIHHNKADRRGKHDAPNLPNMAVNLRMAQHHDGHRIADDQQRGERVRPVKNTCIRNNPKTPRLTSTLIDAGLHYWLT